MKRAFDANVSRAKPRLRLGAALASGGDAQSDAVAAAAVEAIARQVAVEPLADDGGGAALAEALKARSPTGEAAAAPPRAGASAHPFAERQAPVAAPPAVRPFQANTATAQAPHGSRLARSALSPRAAPEATALPPPDAVEVQTEVDDAPTAPPPAARRERLKERLRAVREAPRQDPLPNTAAEAGLLAVERIASLQVELEKARALNQAVVLDLDASRRQAERATEEAKSRSEEAHRLTGELEGRARLLTDLESELSALESERDLTLSALQDARQALGATADDVRGLTASLAKKEAEVEECLAEEERLAGELEASETKAAALERSAKALAEERDALAKQVADLTRERAELLEARKALEAVHRALSSAARR